MGVGFLRAREIVLMSHSLNNGMDAHIVSAVLGSLGKKSMTMPRNSRRPFLALAYLILRKTIIQVLYKRAGLTVRVRL